MDILSKNTTLTLANVRYIHIILNSIKFLYSKNQTLISKSFLTLDIVAFRLLFLGTFSVGLITKILSFTVPFLNVHKEMSTLSHFPLLLHLLEAMASEKLL